MFDFMKDTILLSLIIASLSGCVGYYDSRISAPVEKDLTLALMVVPENERMLWKGKVKGSKQEKFINDDRAFPLGTNPIEQNVPSNGTSVIETKIYNDKMRWCGRTIWAIIPIPLMTQSCRTFTELTIQDGEVISAREQYLEKSGRMCGPFIPMMEIAHGFCADSAELQ